MACSSSSIDAFLAAEADDDVRVVILGGAGPLFSSGHDLGSRVADGGLGRSQSAPHAQDQRRNAQGCRGALLQEWHYFFQNTMRWRNLRKITIAQVHGPVYAAGAHADVGVRSHRRIRGHRVR